MGCLQPMGFPWDLGGSDSGRGSDFGIQQALCFVVILDPLVRCTHELPSSSFAGSDICSTWSPDPKLRRKERVNHEKRGPRQFRRSGEVKMKLGDEQSELAGRPLPFASYQLHGARNSQVCHLQGPGRRRPAETLQISRCITRVL